MICSLDHWITLPFLIIVNCFIIHIKGNAINHTTEKAILSVKYTTPLPIKLEFQINSLNLTTTETTNETLSKIENQTILSDLSDGLTVVSRDDKQQQHQQQSQKSDETEKLQEASQLDISQIPIYKISEENIDDSSLFLDDSPTREEDYAGGNYGNDDDFLGPDNTNLSPQND